MHGRQPRPAGAGKTNIAMLSVLREVGANMDARSGVIHKAAFKIVYVAPMKVRRAGGCSGCCQGFLGEILALAGIVEAPCLFECPI